MKGGEPYMIIFVLTSLVFRTESMDYADYGSRPTTDWNNVIPNRTSRAPFTLKYTLKSGDIDVSEYDDSQPSIKIAQDQYILLSMPGYQDCLFVAIYEGSQKRIPRNEKICQPTSNPHLWWVYNFEPDKTNNIKVYDRTDTLLYSEDFDLLPEEPPDITSVNAKSGAGWIELKIRIEKESDPNLVGIAVFYKRDEDPSWWRTYIESVSYKAFTPQVVPVHFCPDFKEDGTYCILLTDGLCFKNESERKVNYKFQVTTFRINPSGVRKLGTPTDVDFSYKYCDWQRTSCYPPMGDTDYESYYDGDEFDDEYSNVLDDFDEYEDMNETETTSYVNYTPKFLLSTTWAPEMWLPNNTIKRPPPKITISEDYLWILALALLIILLAFLLPLAFWLGTRAGYREAERYWTELESSGGNVNIPLGYVGTDWQHPAGR